MTQTKVMWGHSVGVWDGLKWTISGDRASSLALTIAGKRYPRSWYVPNEGSEGEDRALAARIQHGPSTQFVGLSTASARDNSMGGVPPDPTHSRWPNTNFQSGPTMRGRSPERGCRRFGVDGLAIVSGCKPSHRMTKQFVKTVLASCLP